MNKKVINISNKPDEKKNNNKGKEITKRDILTLYQALESMKNNNYKVSFSYAIAKAIHKITPEYESLKEVNDNISKINSAFIEENNNLIRKYGVSSPEGNIHIDPTNKEALKKYYDDRAKLEEKYKKENNEYIEKMKDFEKLLDEKIAVNLPQIALTALPENNAMSPATIEILINSGMLPE